MGGRTLSGGGCPAWPPDPLGTWVLDLDGVVWLAGEPIAGVTSAVTMLRRAGARVLFATNNASPTLAELLTRLQRAGIDAEEADVASAAYAAASMVQAGERILVIGEQGLHAALEERGAVIVEEPPVDAVIVARAPQFDYTLLALASACVRDGARLIGTSQDPTHPTPEGLVPGSGAVLAAVVTAAGVQPEVAGKPHAAMCELVRARASDVAVVVGDRPSTDGVLAERLGACFALVESCATPSDSSEGAPTPQARAADLRTLVEQAIPAGD